MKVDFLNALDEIEKERGIGKEVLMEAIEDALTAAYKRNYGATQNVRVSIDRNVGEIKVYNLRSIVEEITNPETEITLDEAKSIKPSYRLGDVYEREVSTSNFGRIAAQTAKQVIVQRIREAERGVIFEEFIEKQDEIIVGVVSRVERNNVYLGIGRSEGYLPPSEQARGERYAPNDRLRVYIVEVRKTARGPQIIVSRSHPGLIKRLFENEVPEVKSGIVEIKGITREAGYRTKMAVYSHDEDVDPVGACVGQRGMRVERVVAELGNERIDIVPWSDDPAEYIANALSPAKVSMVRLNERDKIARIVVSDNQLSLAIGREGQNARLAAKLTGWKIDIKSQSQVMMEASEEALRQSDEDEDMIDDIEEAGEYETGSDTQ